MEKATIPNLKRLAGDYITRLPSHARAAAQQELWRFIRWCGGDRDISSLSPNDIASYAQWAAPSGGESLKRLEPVKTFLAHLEKRGYVKENLGIHLKVVKGNKKTSIAPKAPIETIPVTKDGYLKLQRDLEKLKVERTSMPKILQAARADKDFRENAPLDAAREQQGKLESRIRELESVLRAAVIMEEGGEKPKNASKAARLGTRVTLRDAVTGDLVSYTLVGTNEANLSDGKLSATSPTGKVILDKPEGAEVEVTAPMGNIKYFIEKIES